MQTYTRETSSRMTLSLFLTLAFVFVEVVAGLFANSLVLLTDAAHNFTDVIALALSGYALRLTTRPSNSQRTYGYHRAGILVALTNSFTLMLIALGIFYEAYQRLRQPPAVNASILIGVGSLAFVVNIVTAMLVRRGSENDLNVRSVFYHLMGDVISTLGAVLAGVVIYFTGASWLDPLVSALIGGLILFNAWGILRDTVDILLEATPRDVDMSAMVAEMKQVDGVLDIHDLHVWSLTEGLRSMSAHVLTQDISLSAGADIQTRVKEMLSRRYNIFHATLQLECAGCSANALYCDIHNVVHVHEPAHSN